MQETIEKLKALATRRKQAEDEPMTIDADIASQVVDHMPKTIPYAKDFVVSDPGISVRILGVPAGRKEAVQREIVDLIYEAENYRQPVSVVAVTNGDEINNTNQGGCPYA